MQSLTVLYDADCGICRRARAWLESRRQLVPLRFVAAASNAARSRFPGIDVEQTLQRLTVIGDDGRVWYGRNAWIMCLWALKRHRRLAVSLAGPGLRGLAGLVESSVARNRHELSRILGYDADVPRHSETGPRSGEERSCPP